MARIAGIKTQKDAKGNLTHVTINIKKHKEVLPLLEQMGVIEKSRVEKLLETGEWFTVEEARKKSIAFINSLKWDK